MTSAGLCVVLAILLPWIPSTPAMSVLQPVVPIQSEPPATPWNPNMTFFMYPTPAASEAPVVNDIKTGILPGQPLTILTHGFKGDSLSKSVASIREALQQAGVPNLVVVDWAPLADQPDLTALNAYHHVRDYGVREAASQLAQWLQHVTSLKGIPLQQVHVIGFSLGAHLAGHAGALLNSTLGRITGLDPPRFGYERVKPLERLDAEDAMFVNVIHTSGGVLGYAEVIGHVDFFPNGDVMPQVGCGSDNAVDLVTCSHYFAYAVFAESVFYERAFVATECSSWALYTAGLCDSNQKVPMGFFTPDTARGKFYMKTNDNPPYGEENPDQPLPDYVKKMLVYDPADGILNSTNVNFLTIKETDGKSSDVSNKLSAESQLEDTNDSKVWRAKGRSSSSTTESPPAFQNSSPVTSAINGISLAAIVGFSVLQWVWPGATLLYDVFSDL